MASIIRKIVARYEADIGNFERGIAEAARKHEAFAAKVKEGADKTKRANDDAGKSVTILGQKFVALSPVATKHIGEVVAATSKMRLAMAGAAGVVSGVMATAFIGLADQAKSAENQLRGIGAASDEMRKKVYALAIETRTPLESTIGLLRSMQKSLQDQSLDETLRQVGTLNRLLTIGGLDAGQRGSVALQFGQALQSGILQGDELRALRESAPFELMDAIAKRAGGSVESLKDLGTQGKLTRDVMVGALEDLEQVSRDKFGDFQMTVRDAMTVFNTSLVGTVGEIDKAVGASATLADALAGLAGFMSDHAGAAATLAQALSVVGQTALLAAGSRGLVALGSTALVVGDRLRVLAGEMVVSATASGAASTAFMALQRSMSGALALMGGPWGLAVFAASAAMIMLAADIDSVQESLDDTRESLDQFQQTNDRIKSTTAEIATDRESLIAVNKRITDSINAQGDAAAAVAAREATAINARIAKNEQLLETYRAIAQEELNQSRNSLRAAERKLQDQALQAQGVLSAQYGVSSDPVLRERIMNSYARQLSAQSAQGQRLTDDQVEYLRLYAEIFEQRTKLFQAEAAFADASPHMANAHVLAYQKQAKAAADASKVEETAIEALNKKYDERQAKLKELNKQLSAAQAQADKSTIGSPEHSSAMRAIQSAQNQISELRQVEDRMASMKGKVDEVNSALAQSGGMFDPGGVLRQRVDWLEKELREAELAGTDLDEVTLNMLETAIINLTARAKELGIELRNAASTDFDSLAARMREGALPYASDVAGAAAVNTNMIDFIKRKEGVLFEAKYDENHWRVGYGSDKIYRQGADGTWSPETVGPGTRINQREADYSLQMRLMKEFIPPIVAAIGQDRWNSYNANQQAAMASLSWNYGPQAWSNPNTLGRVATAAVQGTPQDVADAIASLALQRTKSEQEEGIKTKDGLPMNYHRRMEEAGLFGDTSATADQASAITAEYREQVQLEEQRAKRRDEYLRSLNDENEKIALQRQISGKTIEEQDKILRIYERQKAAKEAGYELDERVAGSTQTLREQIVDQVEREIDMENRRANAQDARIRKEEEAAQRREEYAARLNERLEFQAQVQRDIQGIIVGSLMRTGDWRQMVVALIEKLAEAYLYAGLFNTGPLSREGGGGGLLGGAVNIITGWLTGGKKLALGGVMTEYGELPLRKYSFGGIARSPQLAIYGEGRQPEAYVPLPDGRTIPVTIKTPDVPSLAGNTAAAGLMRLAIDLNNEMLQARIVETSAPVSAEITRSGIKRFSDDQLPTRVRQANSDPKRIK